MREIKSLRREGSSKPGTCTSTRSWPWRWMVGSVVPTSSTRLRMTSMDCAISDDMRSVTPSCVSVTVSLPSGVSPNASSGVPPMPSVPEILVCSVSSAVRAAAFWLGSVSSTVMPSAWVVMMLPMPRWPARSWRASRRRSFRRSEMIESRLTCSSRCEPPCRSRPSVMPSCGRKFGQLAVTSLEKKFGIARRIPSTETMRIIAVRSGENCSIKGIVLASRFSSPCCR